MSAQRIAARTLLPNSLATNTGSNENNPTDDQPSLDENPQDENKTQREQAHHGSAPPHSLHTPDSPIGYAHAGQRPCFTRTNRRSANGPQISSQRTAA